MLTYYVQEFTELLTTLTVLFVLGFWFENIAKSFSLKCKQCVQADVCT